MKLKWLIALVLVVCTVPVLAADKTTKTAKKTNSTKAANTVKDSDRLKLDETSIQGASELPKVLYIVPWKKSAPDNKPVHLKSMVDDVMAPVDQEVLRRQLQFYRNRTGDKEEPKVATSKTAKTGNTSKTTNTSAVQKK